MIISLWTFLQFFFSVLLHTSDFPGLINMKLVRESMPAAARVQIQYVGFCKRKFRMQGEKSSEQNAAFLTAAIPKFFTVKTLSVPLLFSILYIPLQPHWLPFYTHTHTHRHSYYTLIPKSNLTLLSLSSFVSPLHPSLSFLPLLLALRRREKTAIVISMETAQQQAWRWQPIRGLPSSASHPMAEAGEGGLQEGLWACQGECSGRLDQDRLLPGWTENVSIFMLSGREVRMICKLKN